MDKAEGHIREEGVLEHHEAHHRAKKNDVADTRDVVTLYGAGPTTSFMNTLMLTLYNRGNMPATQILTYYPAETQASLDTKAAAHAATKGNGGIKKAGT